MADPAPRVIGLIVEQLRAFFTPNQDVPVLGGGTDLIHVVAGEAAPPPVWFGNRDSDCGDPYLWVRLVTRFRTKDFPAPADATDCRTRRALTIEAGIARCVWTHPDPSPDELEEQALVQMDDGWRMDLALCAAMGEAVRVQAVTDTAIGVGEPYGPEGGTAAWLQSVSVQF